MHYICLWCKNDFCSLRSWSQKRRNAFHRIGPHPLLRSRSTQSFRPSLLNFHFVLQNLHFSSMRRFASDDWCRMMRSHIRTCSSHWPLNSLNHGDFSLAAEICLQREGNWPARSWYLSRDFCAFCEHFPTFYWSMMGWGVFFCFCWLIVLGLFFSLDVCAKGGFFESHNCSFLWQFIHEIQFATSFCFL